jgi:CHASE2 domain-containing sensor protein
VGNVLKFIELLAAALWFGGAAVLFVLRAPRDPRFRPVAVGGAVALTAVTVSRVVLWHWSPAYSIMLGLTAIGIAGERQHQRLAAVVAGLGYLVWMAIRGY